MVLDKDELERRLRGRTPDRKSEIKKRYERYQVLYSLADNDAMIKGTTIGGLGLAGISALCLGYANYIANHKFSSEELLVAGSMVGLGLANMLIGNIIGRAGNYIDRRKYSRLVLQNS